MIPWSSCTWECCVELVGGGIVATFSVRFVLFLFFLVFPMRVSAAVCAVFLTVEPMDEERDEPSFELAALPTRAILQCVLRNSCCYRLACQSLKGDVTVVEIIAKQSHSVACDC